MRNCLYLAFLTSLTCMTGEAAAITYPQCNAMASQINKSLPMDIDAVTKMKSVICLPGKVKPTLMYLYEIDASSMPSVSASDLLTLKPNMVESWCSMPTQLELLRQVNVLYNYRKLSGRFIGEIKISEEDC
jgi:hypothetical protein